MSTQDFLLVVDVYIVGLIMQLAVWPGFRKVLRKSVDKGWGTTRVAGWLVISLWCWWGGFLGFPIKLTMIPAELGLLLVGIFFLLKERKGLRKEIRKLEWLILAEESLFALGLFGLSWIRTFNPNILDLEKFMDAGFIASYLRAGRLPAIDMWLAGDKINYYTFGHFMGAVMVRIWGIDLAYSYNLLLGWLMGLVLMGSFSVVANLSEGVKTRKIVIGGVIGSLLVALGGNTHTIWYLLKNGNFTNYWYADATRFIENTIHEFPSYSFIVSDLHAHVWDLPIVLVFLVVLKEWVAKLEKGEGEWLSVVMGALVGVMAMTNTWDVFIYGMVTGLAGLILLFRGVKWDKLLSAASKFGVAFVAVAALWMLNFVSISEGIREVTKRSPLWQLLVLWGIHLTITVFAIAVNLRAKKKSVMVNVMAMSAVILLVIPEVIYFKDIYPNHPRANTMFKFTYQSFVLMSLLGGWLVSNFKVELRNKVLSVVLAGISSVTLAAAFFALMIFPYFGYRDYYGGLKIQKGLDGLTWLRLEHSDDYLGIEWLKENTVGRPTLVEAVGESYTEFGRVSAITGLPTILGWRVHEWLWRGGFEIPAARTQEVTIIYEQPDSEKTKELLKKYEVRFIFVGDKEFEAYRNLEVAKLEKLGEVVFRSGETEIIEVK